MTPMTVKNDKPGHELIKMFPDESRKRKVEEPEDFGPDDEKATMELFLYVAVSCLLCAAIIAGIVIVAMYGQKYNW